MTFRTPLEVLQADISKRSLEALEAFEAELEEMERVDRERQQGGSWAENLGPVVD
jgi:hypothetical protein